MGLYYRAILSSLLLNFLPDLPRPFFFTPQYPILFFFHFGFYFFSFFLPHYCRFTTSKKKKNRLICLCRGNVLFFFFHTKVPIFCEDCRPELAEAYHNSKDGDLNTEGIMTQKVATLYFYCGSSDSCFQLTIWRMACPHYIDILTEPPPK